MITAMNFEEFCREYLAGNIEIVRKEPINQNAKPHSYVDAGGNITTEEYYGPEFKIKKYIRTYDEDEKLHNVYDDPSEMEFNEAGILVLERWYDHGIISRDPESGPAYMKHIPEESATEEHFILHGKYIVNDNPNFQLFRNDVLVAEEWRNEDGILHREINKGPARIEYKDGKKVKFTYCLNGGERFTYEA